jgi:hypothetical protein
MLNNEPNNRMQLTGPAFWFSKWLEWDGVFMDIKTDIECNRCTVWFLVRIHMMNLNVSTSPEARTFLRLCLPGNPGQHEP